MGGALCFLISTQDAVSLQEPQGAQLQNQQSFGPCSLEIKQFLECAQNQSDVKLCEGFNEVLRQCRIANGRRLVPLLGVMVLNPVG